MEEQCWGSTIIQQSTSTLEYTFLWSFKKLLSTTATFGPFVVDSRNRRRNHYEDTQYRRRGHQGGSRVTNSFRNNYYRGNEGKHYICGTNGKQFYKNRFQQNYEYGRHGNYPMSNDNKIVFNGSNYAYNSNVCYDNNHVNGMAPMFNNQNGPHYYGNRKMGKDYACSRYIVQCCKDKSVGMKYQNDKYKYGGGYYKNDIYATTHKPPHTRILNYIGTHRMSSSRSHTFVGNKMEKSKRLSRLNAIQCSRSIFQGHSYKIIGNKVKLSIEGQSVEALVDTGATLSVISQNMCKNVLCLPEVPIDISDVDSCKLANGEEVSISHKTYAMISIGGIRVKVKFYVISGIYINMILGCDILNHLGAVINFTDQTIHFTWKPVQTDSNFPRLGLLEGAKTSRAGNILCFKPLCSEIIEPKSSKRIILQADQEVNVNTLLNHGVKVNEDVSIQLQLEKLGDQKVSTIVAIIRNENCQPKCLLPTDDVMTIQSRDSLMTLESNDDDNSIMNKIDLTESDLDSSQR